MKLSPIDIAWGLSFTISMFGTAELFFWLSDRIGAPVIPQIAFVLGMIAVIPLLPGCPLGFLSLNMHSIGFLLLTLIGDIVFYSFVAHRVLTIRARTHNRVTEVKS